jgi:hypothetical protein
MGGFKALLGALTLGLGLGAIVLVVVDPSQSSDYSGTVQNHGSSGILVHLSR